MKKVLVRRYYVSDEFVKKRRYLRIRKVSTELQETSEATNQHVVIQPSESPKKDKNSNFVPPLKKRKIRMDLIEEQIIKCEEEASPDEVKCQVTSEAVKEDEIKVKKIEVKEVKEDEVKEVKEDEVKEVKEDEVKEVKQDEVKEVKEDEVKEVKQDEVKEVKQDEVKEDEVTLQKIEVEEEKLPEVKKSENEEIETDTVNQELSEAAS